MYLLIDLNRDLWKKMILNDLFWSKHCFILFNVNERLTVPFTALARVGSHVGHLFLLFTKDYLSEHSYSHTSLILLIAWNLLLFVVCFVFVCVVDQTQLYPSSISSLGLFRGSYVILKVCTSLFIGGLEFLKNHRRRDQDFLVKMGDVAHIGGCLWKRR